MKKMLAIGLLVLLSGSVHAAIVGKLQLGAPPQGYIMRDVKNGQYRGGEHKKLWELSRVYPDGSVGQILYVGFSQTWNAEHGNHALGPTVGKDATLADVATFALGLVRVDAPGVPKFLSYLGHITSINVAASFMPIHDRDVVAIKICGFDTKMIGGIGAIVDLSDVFAILQKGL